MTASTGTGTSTTAERLTPAARSAGLVVLLAALAVFPLVFTNAAITNYGVLTLIFVAAAAGWNIFSGYSGYISLGHAVFFGTGAYFTGVATNDWHLQGSDVFALLPLTGLVGAILAVPFGIVALRVRRHTFVVVTIAVFFIFQLMAYNLPSLTGGTSGLLAPTINFQAATYNNPFYYAAFAIAVATVAASWLIRRSRFGLQLRAIRDDEDRASGLGVRAMPVKLGAFVISAVPVAMVGGLLWYYIGLIDPASGFDPLFDLAIVLMAFLGGFGTVAGPVLGALLIEPVRLYFQQQTSYIYLILYGVLFLVVIVALPRGIIPTTAERLGQWRARRRGDGSQPAAGSAGAAGTTGAVTDRASERA